MMTTSPHGYSAADDTKILAGAAAGKSFAEIAASLDPPRNKGAIWGRLQILRQAPKPARDRKGETREPHGYDAGVDMRFTHKFTPPALGAGITQAMVRAGR
jgi:hypothetical protein